jgi:membrane associated rhomboid family serine protease
MAFLVEDRPRQPFLHVPAVVVWLISALIGTHALRVFVFSRQSEALFVAYGFVPARYSSAFLAAHPYDPGTIFERAVPFVSYIFLHGSFMHVAINSVWLLAFGPIVTRRFGSLLFLVFFLVCGIAGAAAHLVCNWGSAAPVIGASAAVSGLMAAGFRMLPVVSPRARQDLAPIFAPRVLVWTALWVAVNVIAGLTGLGSGGGPQLIAWQAHLGGYAAGLLLAGPFDALAARGQGKVPAAEA